MGGLRWSAVAKAAGVALTALCLSVVTTTAPAVPRARTRAGLAGVAARYRVGAVFSLTGRPPRHYCTASVVDSPRRDLAITAAHCVHGGAGGAARTDLAFAPGYRAGGGPVGLWRVRRVFVAPRWEKATDSAVDVAFLVLEPRNGRDVQDVVGGNPVAVGRTPGRVRLVGYPSDADEAVSCTARAERPSPDRLRVRCPGFTTGTSGSPWLADAPGGRSVVGVIGGYHRGGSTADVSYSSYFDSEVAELLRRASTGR